MSDGTLYKARILEEVTWGTTPASAMQEINVSSFPLGRTDSSQRAEVYTGDRRKYPSRRVETGGEISGLTAPLQYGNLTLLHEGLMNADEEAVATITDTDISVSSGVIASVAGDMSVFANGDLVFISGFTEAANNGWHGPVTSAGASSITVPTGQVTDEVAGDTVTISTIRLWDGSTPKSYSAEWEDTGLTNKFRSGTGFRVGNITWSWEQGQFVTESVTMAGKAPTKASATIGTGAATAAPTSGFLTAVDDWGTLHLAEAATSVLVSSLELSVDNTLNLFRGLGAQGPSQIEVGGMMINLSITALYDANGDTLLGNIESEDTLSWWWDVVDPQGNRYAFFVPAAKAESDDLAPASVGNLTSFTATLTGHDPNKDNDSAYVSAGFPGQLAIFKKAA